MKKFSFMKFMSITLMVLACAFNASCVDDNDDTEAPYLEVLPATLSFDVTGQPVGGGPTSFQISTNRSWKAIVQNDKTWVTLSATEGNGSADIEVSIPEGINDQASVTIEISNKVGVLLSETVTIVSGSVVPGEVIYNETFGTAAPASSPYPFVDQYTDWVTTGLGASTVSYSGVSASLRQSGSTSAGYTGASGASKVYFGSGTPTFTVNKITLPNSETDLKLTFGANYYKFDTKDGVFKPEKFHFYLSADGENWSDAVSYTTVDADDSWVYATSNFTLKNATSTLYIKFAVDEASTFSLDDPTLSTGPGGQEVDLGDTTAPEDAKVITIPEMIAAMTDKQEVLDATADRFFEAVVQNDVAGGNITSNNLVLSTIGATTAGNGITLYGSQVDPKTLGVTAGDKVKVTLYKGLAKLVKFNGLYEVTGAKEATWAKVEKIGTAAVTPVVITADKLIDYQGMAVTIQTATAATAGVWAKTGVDSSTSLMSDATSFVVFCNGGENVFVDTPFMATTASISGLVGVYKNNVQLVPRNLDDVKGFNSTDPLITGVNPTSLSFDAAGGTKTVEISVANQGSNALSISGLSGLLTATLSGTTVTVVATENTGAAIEQTLTITLAEGNTKTVPVSVKAKSTGGGYSVISTIESLSAGKYLMSGFVVLNNKNDDLTPFNYQVWTGAVSFTGSNTTSNSDLVTVSYEYAGNQLTPKNAAEAVDTEIELVAVAGKANTYYIKVGAKYLYNSAAVTNRRLYLSDTTDGAEWVFMNKSNGDGVTASNNETYLITASAESNYIRSYKSETQTKVGLFFFKKN